MRRSLTQTPDDCDNKYFIYLLVLSQGPETDLVYINS